MLYSKEQRKELNKNNLRLYSFLSRLPFPKSYVGKILLVTSFGMLVGLLVLTFYCVLSSQLDLESKLLILAITLLATLLVTAIIFYALHALLTPVSLASEKLHAYITNKKVPDLPTHFTDQAGRLMADVQYTVKHLDKVIDSLKKASMTDYLTGVYNRHAGEKRLIEDIARVQRSNDTISLVILDVDNLKFVNDQYGHCTGDTCLKHVINIIKNNIRKGDWLARWGGDEFVLVLFGATEEPSVKTLERVCTALKENPIHTPQGDEINLTLSMGVCEYNGKDDAQTVIVKADDALIQSKRRGKSQIVCYGQ